VKSAQRLGFSLDEIGELLKLEDGTHCSEAAKSRRYGWLTCARLADLARMEAVLSKLVSECCAAWSRVLPAD
jgi:MerR family mercuric resistance operon transcriptional regulator